MPPPDSPATPGQTPSGVLRFGCPACLRELSIPEHLAGVEGPCPLCLQKIAAPIPALGQPARLAAVPEAPPFPTPPPPAPVQEQPRAPVQEQPLAPEPPPPPLPPEDLPSPTPPVARRVHCPSCQTALDVDPQTTVPGGPCPVCQTWIDLRGETQIPPQEPLPIPPTPSTPAAEVEVPRQTTAPPAQRRRRSPGGSSSEPASSSEQDWRQDPREEDREEEGDEEDITYEKRRVKRRKRRRVLPDECYVGAAQRDPRDGPTEGSSGRRKRRSKKPLKLDADKDPAVSRWLPIIFGILIPLIAGVLLALKMGWITPQHLRFWEPRSSTANAAANTGLEKELRQTRQEMTQKEGEAYDAVKAAIYGFLDAETWEEAESYLLSEAVPENSEALSFLKVFPREEFRGCAIRVIRWSRIPDTDRFVFTTQLAVLDQDSGGEKLTFMIAEQQESGDAAIHALQLYQSWKQSLTEFLETPGANEGRFYTLVQWHDGHTGPAPITLPDDSEYVRLRLQDNFVSHYWTTDAYVRKDSYPGIRFSTKLTGADWCYAILDLEWLQGPAGDSFVNVKGLHSSNWGDFHR